MYKKQVNKNLLNRSVKPGHSERSVGIYISSALINRIDCRASLAMTLYLTIMHSHFNFIAIQITQVNKAISVDTYLQYKHLRSLCSTQIDALFESFQIKILRAIRACL